MTTLATMERTWRIQLPIAKPISLNHRLHYRVKAQQTADMREAAGWMLKAAKVPPLAHVRTWVEYRPRDARRRDPINLVPTLKACEDALVDAGVVPDDNPAYVESMMPKILPNAAGSLIVFVVQEALL